MQILIGMKCQTMKWSLMVNNKFNIGDVVECINDFYYCNGPFKGKIYKVKSTNSGSIGIEVPECNYQTDIRNGNMPNWGNSSFKLVNEEAYLQDLVKKANEGFLARNKLFELTKDRFEFRWANETEFTKIDTIAHLMTEVRLKPVTPKETKFTLQNWEVTITKEKVRVGCQEFQRKELYDGIFYMSKGDTPSRGFNVNRKGIFYNGNTLTWENADILLKELENYEKG